LFTGKFDMTSEYALSRVLVFAVVTGVNIVVFSTAAYRGVEFMDSPPFCGRTCHTVIKPEFTAYESS